MPEVYNAIVVITRWSMPYAPDIRRNSTQKVDSEKIPGSDRESDNGPSVGVDGPQRHQACQNEVA